MMTATFVFMPGQQPRITALPGGILCCGAGRSKKDTLIPGTRVTGTYAPHTEAFAQVVDRWELEGKARAYTSSRP